MRSTSRRFAPSLAAAELEPRKLLDGSGLPSVPGNPPPTYPGDSNIVSTPPPNYDPLAPTFVSSGRDADIVNMDDGTNAAYSVQ